MIFSCTYHKKEIFVEECPVKITFQNKVKAIIDLHCAVSGCHVGGFPQGDFTTYAGLKEKVDNGIFRLNVIDLKSMPPIDKPDLSEEEIVTLECWLQQGATEN